MVGGYHLSNACTKSLCGNGVCESPETCTSCPADCWQCGCDTSTCKLPNCKCADLAIPGGLALEETPQFVVLTLDDYINDDVWPEIESVMKNSPRDALSCPPRTTLFMHGYGQHYDLIEKLLEMGGELACHTATHATSYTTTLKEWRKQISISNNCLNKLVEVNHTLSGSRAPFLFWSATMMKALAAEGVMWDSSIICNYEDHGGWPWPFLVQYGIPKLSYFAEAVPSSEKIWELPLYAPLNPNTNSSEECMDPLDNWTPNDILPMLKSSFEKHYRTNRAPYGIYWHPATLTRLARSSLLINFLKFTQQFSDVYYATMSEVVDWVRYPKPASQFRSSGGFNCGDVVVNVDNDLQCMHGYASNATVCDCADTSLRLCTKCPPADYVVGDLC
ncbi:glycoside hydrolase/deacetylase [Pelomyxa schiedti]|nr:glycoside hydrolase/deacetylase [Pelomyxa schiedti]